jgi:hypothetical protein
MKNAWGEWKERCALGLCSEATHTILHEFALTRFRRYLARCVPPRQVRALMPSAVDAWHLFETHLVTDADPRGKSYKQWLFDRRHSTPTSSTDHIEGAAALLMRDAVKSFVRREHAPAMMCSLDHLVAKGYQTDVTLLLPDSLTPADETSWHEQETLATEAALSWMKKLSFRQRIALLGRALGLPLSHASITDLADCGKTTLSDTYRKLVIQLGEATQSAFEDESSDAHVRLTMVTLNTLTTRVHAWARRKGHVRHLLAREAETK